MKNIKFDESLVLREYARIASEKGLIKEAQEEELVDMSAGLGEPTVDMYAKYKDRLEGAGEIPSIPKLPIEEINNYALEALKRLNTRAAGYLRVKDINEAYNLMRAPIAKEVAQLQQQFGHDPKAAEPIESFMEQAKKFTQKEGPVDKGASIKQAAGKDVNVFVSKLEELFRTGALGTSWDQGQKAIVQGLLRDAKHQAKSMPLQKIVNYLVEYIRKNAGIIDNRFALLFTKGSDRLVEVVSYAQKMAQQFAMQPATTKPALQDILNAVKNPALKHRLQQAKLDPNLTPDQFKEYLRLLGFTATPEELVPLIGKISAYRPALSKRAKGEQVYDVSGETGDQLVEKAHPGGGTKTELTHSKTDENLVETIVEQQKRDVDVANSIPKGTYAMLVNLYNELHKMGHEEHLSPLISTINTLGKKKIAAWYDYSPTYAVYKKLFGPSAGVIGSIVDRLEDLDPADDASGKQVQHWITTLRGYKSNLLFVPTTSDKAEQKQMSLKKQTQLGEVINFLTQMQDGFAQLNLSDIGADIQEAQQAILSGVRSIRQRYLDVGPELVAVEPGDEERSGEAGKGETQRTAPGDVKAQRRSRWAKFYNNALKSIDEETKQGMGLAPLSNKDAVNGNKNYWTAIKAVKASGAKTLREFVSIIGKGESGKGELKPKPEADTPEYAAAEKTRTQMLNAVLKGVSDRGYTGIGPTERSRLSQIVRTNSDVYDVSNTKGAEMAWEVIRKEINRLYPPKK